MNNKTILQSNLEWLMKKNGFNANSLATAAKVSQATLFRIITGISTDHRFSTLAPLADFFEIPVEELRNKDLTGKRKVLSEKTRGLIPLIPWAQAGDFKAFQDEDMKTEWIVSVVPPRKYTYALRVIGDGMLPKFSEDDIIVIEPEIHPENGDFVIAQINNKDPIFKKLVIDGSDRYLVPLNDKYRTILMNENDQIIGVVRAKKQIFR